MEWTKQYKKAVTFSYDDGNEQDIRLVELLNRCGLKCTFNINTGLDAESGAWQYKGEWVRRIPLAQLPALYQGHEAAVHGVRHLALTSLTEAELETELGEDVRSITAAFGTAPQGMAYAYGDYNDTVVAQLPRFGIRYARIVEPSHSFALQSDLLRFRPTCHHDDEALFELAKRFLEMQSDEPQIFYIWGHSYEFDGNHNWDRMERLCEMLAGKPDVFYGTNAQVLL